jgi:hypothetical protein
MSTNLYWEAGKDMAKLEKSMQGNFDVILNRIEKGILDGSVTASLEDSSDFQDGNTRCSVRVFERYSVMGGNRLSLSVTLFQGESGIINLSAVAAGGSQAMFFKVNTFGEEAFLDKLSKLI